MWENRNRKTAILTTVLLTSALIIGLIGSPHMALAQEDDNAVVAAEQAVPNDELSQLEEDVSVEESATAQLTVYRRATTYPEYLEKFTEIVRPNKEIIVPAENIVNTTTDIEVLYDYEGVPGRSVRTGERGYVEWQVEVEEAGFYNIEVMYYPVVGRSAPIQRAIEINGTRPFLEAGYLTLPRTWGDAGPIEEDIYGNQLRPRQVEKPMWRTQALSDPSGYESLPFLFYFEEGTNTIKLEAISESAIIHSLRLYQHEAPRPYAEV